MKKLLSLSFPILFAFVFPQAGYAFLSVQESNEITPQGKFKLGFEPQLKLSRGSGANFAGFIDAPINEEMSVRGNIGGGDIDFFAGGSFKWVPVPDYDNQPAVGGKISAVFFREGSEGYTSLGAAPIVSKKFETEVGRFTPYGSLPINLVNGNSKTVTDMNIVLGSEYFTTDYENLTFGLELGFDLRDSYSYLSGYMTIYLDDKR